MSLRSVLIKVYGQQAVMSPKTSAEFVHWGKVTKDALAPYKVYCGHENFREKPLGRRVVAIAMVRNPADRLVSIYRYVRGREDHKLWKLAREHDIATFYERAAEVMPNYVLNLQARRVSGGTDAEQAIDLVKNRYLAVGTSEFLNEFVAGIGQALRWPPGTSIGHRNKAKTPLDFEIPEKFHAWVRETNASDIKLYEFVLAAWKARAETADR